MSEPGRRATGMARSCAISSKPRDRLLPNRSTETVAGWLCEHPSVQVVSLDRACAFADAITKGAHQAVQVEDRWQVRNNLIDTLGDLLSATAVPLVK